MPRYRALLAALCAAAAFLAVVLITQPPGPGLDPDAAAYLGGAVSLARTGALRVPAADWATADSLVPLVHFPPGFSTAIAVPYSLGMSPAQAARLVVASSGAVTAGLFAWLAAGAVGGLAGLAAGALALFLAALTPAALTTHLSVLSEPLYLACLAAVLVALADQPMGRSAARPLAAGVAAAAATMVRYVGLSAAGAAALWALSRPGPWRRRVRDAALAGGPAGIAFVAWALRARRLAAGEEVRTIGVYGGWGASAAAAGRTARAWLAPTADPAGLAWLPVVALLAGVAAVVLFLTGARLAARAPAPPTPLGGAEGVVDRGAAGRALGAAGLLAACHLGFVLVSRLFADPGIPFDERILAPAIFLAAFTLAVSAGLVWRASGRAARVATAAGLVAWIAAATVADAGILGWVRAEGSDFASRRWRDSPTLAWARSAGAGRTLYSNWPQVLFLHAGRPVRSLPETADSVTLAEFDAVLARTGGALVVFAEPSPDVAPPNLVVRGMGLREVARFSDGAVWERVPPPFARPAARPGQALVRPNR